MLTVLIGVVLQFGGYYGMWLAAMGRFDCSYVGMLLLAMAACNGQAWYETAGLVTSVRNFETERYVAAAPAPLPPVFPCGPRIQTLQYVQGAHVHSRGLLILGLQLCAAPYNDSRLSRVPSDL